MNMKTLPKLTSKKIKVIKSNGFMQNYWPKWPFFDRLCRLSTATTYGSHLQHVSFLYFTSTVYSSPVHLLPYDQYKYMLMEISTIYVSLSLPSFISKVARKLNNLLANSLTLSASCTIDWSRYANIPMCIHDVRVSSLAWIVRFTFIFMLLWRSSKFTFRKSAWI